MKKAIWALCLALAILLVGAGCRTEQQAPQTEPDSPEQTPQEELYALAVQLTDHLNRGEADAALAMMDQAMTKAMTGQLEGLWAQLTGGAGPFVETGDYICTTSGEYEVLEMTLVFQNGTVIQRTVFDSQGRISGLFYSNGEVTPPSASGNLPDGVTEETVTVNAGDGFPLEGLLTMPKDGTACAAVVFVHGSGPSDRNAAIGANGLFRDLAWSLAERGIATLRYDKRTFTYGAAMAAAGGGITIDEEAALDAVAAVKLAKTLDGIDADRVYLLGHSMGGGLVSYINSLGADCAGYIVLAGSPRSLWELSADQNLLVADEREEAGEADSAKEIRDFVEQERLRGQRLADLSDGETLFGMPVAYLRQLEQIDAVGLHLNDKLPLLILQGEADRQVTMADLALWQEGLKSHPDAVFRSYPGLNHLFGAYTGDPVPFSQVVSVEYAQRTPVPDRVIDDIADWISK